MARAIFPKVEITYEDETGVKSEIVEMPPKLDNKELNEWEENLSTRSEQFVSQVRKLLFEWTFPYLRGQSVSIPIQPLSQWTEVQNEARTGFLLGLTAMREKGIELPPSPLS